MPEVIDGAQPELEVPPVVGGELDADGYDGAGQVLADQRSGAVLAARLVEPRLKQKTVTVKSGHDFRAGRATRSRDSKESPASAIPSMKFTLKNVYERK